MICTVRPAEVSNHDAVKLAPLSIVLFPLTATGDPGWRIDVSARGVASVELGDSTQMRDAIVPAVGARFAHVLDMLASSRAVGVVLGANLAITSARYMSPGSGTGLRLEPELELGLTMRL